ncbi:MAG: hypothetical protein KGZ70_12960 [Hydrogenophaga sp.]|nr:hypothetical protein [Hydrogenophaga sp.]
MTIARCGCDMSPVKVVDATPSQLDWLVTLAELNRSEDEGDHIKDWVKEEILSGARSNPYTREEAWMWPIIDREGIALRRLERRNKIWMAIRSDDLGDEPGASWKDFTFKDLPKTAATSRRQCFIGVTAFEAAARCHAAWRFGETVVVPAHL